jgi:hypothetical protein
VRIYADYDVSKPVSLSTSHELVSSMAYEIKRRSAGPERLVRWDGDQVVDRQALREEMRRAAYPAQELTAATA